MRNEGLTNRADSPRMTFSQVELHGLSTDDIAFNIFFSQCLRHRQKFEVFYPSIFIYYYSFWGCPLEVEGWDQSC